MARDEAAMAASGAGLSRAALLAATRASVGLWTRASGALPRLAAPVEEVAGGLLGGALRVEERAAMGIWLAEARLDRDGPLPGLFDWERAWLARRLSPAPAALLVGGAGAGREAVALRLQGYRVDAFDPAPSLARRCASALGAGADVFAARYEELAAALLDGAAGVAARLRGRRYDAILLGWGSFTHVLEAAERLRLLRACALLAPEGPILASFWAVPPEVVGPPAGALAPRLGRALGSAAGWLRGLPPPPPHLCFAPHCGFAHAFTREEIAALGRAVGWKAVWEEDERWPHATFSPD